MRLLSKDLFIEIDLFRYIYLIESKTILKIRILDISLFVRKAKINPNVLLANARMLNKITAKYSSSTRVEVKTFMPALWENR